MWLKWDLEELKRHMNMLWSWLGWQAITIARNPIKVIKHKHTQTHTYTHKKKRKKKSSEINRYFTKEKIEAGANWCSYKGIVP